MKGKSPRKPLLIRDLLKSWTGAAPEHPGSMEWLERTTRGALATCSDAELEVIRGRFPGDADVEREIAARCSRKGCTSK